MPEYVIPNLKNAIKILDFMNRFGKPLTNAEISKAIKVPKTTVLRIMSTLESCNVVKKVDKSYIFGDFILDIADSTRLRERLYDKINPYLIRLRDETGETSHLCIFANSNGYVLRECETNHPLRSTSKEGTIVCLHTSSAGKVMLAELLDQYPDFINRLDYEKRTPKSIRNATQMLAELRKVKAQGWGFDDEENIIGVRCLSVPLKNASGIFLGSLGITGPTPRMTSQNIAKMVPILKKTAEAFSHVSA